MDDFRAALIRDGICSEDLKKFDEVQATGKGGTFLCDACARKGVLVPDQYK